MFLYKKWMIIILLMNKVIINLRRNLFIDYILGNIFLYMLFINMCYINSIETIVLKELNLKIDLSFELFILCMVVFVLILIYFIIKRYNG